MCCNRKEEGVVVYKLSDSVTCFYYLRKNGLQLGGARAPGKMGDWSTVRLDGRASRSSPVSGQEVSVVRFVEHEFTIFFSLGLIYCLCMSVTINDPF